MNLDSNRYILSLCNANSNSINAIHNGNNTNSVVTHLVPVNNIRKRNQYENNFSTKGFMRVENGSGKSDNIKTIYHSTHSSKLSNYNNDSTLYVVTCWIIANEAAMGKQVQSCSNADNNNIMKHNSQIAKYKQQDSWH